MKQKNTIFLHPTINLSKFFCLLVLLNLNLNATETITVHTEADLTNARYALTNQLAADALEVVITKGTYYLTDSILINRSNVTLTGEPGAKLILSAGINKPVIEIGTRSEIPTEQERIEHIEVKNIWIDGNRTAQSGEISATHAWIRNNGIDVRMVSNLTVHNVTVNNNASGGLVLSYKCLDVQVSNSKFENNRFDGVAYYDSSRVFTSNCCMLNNQAAGISLDNEFLNSIFNNCIIENNGSVGIFARNSKELRFYNLAIQSNGEFAFFLSHDEANRGVHDIMISTCHILHNRGGIKLGSVNNHQSSGVCVLSSVFRGNEADGLANISSDGSTLHSTANIEF